MNRTRITHATLLVGLCCSVAFASRPVLGANDHYLCYKAATAPQTPKFEGTTVNLVDSFEDKDFDVKTLKRICVPVDKNAEGITDASTHLTSYKIKEAVGESTHVKTANNTVTDQFGGLALDTIKPDFLLIPSAKCVDNPPGSCQNPLPVPDPQTHSVDHFKCYKTKTTKKTPKFEGSTVRLEDQFTTSAKDFEVKKPKHFCVPVSKNREPVKSLARSLLCYKAKPVKGEPKHVRVAGVKVSDQLGERTLDTKKEDELCVPALRSVAVTTNTTDIPSSAQAPNTPGSPGVTVTNPNLITQFGAGPFSLNNARYTRFRFEPGLVTPHAILILVPGFEGGANTFKILAENLVARELADHGLAVEVWAHDRRTNQLEDTAGLEIAESLTDATVALDWLFGAELGLSLHPALASGPNRRAVFYNAQSDVPFLANWTNLVFSRDIDAIVEAARGASRDNVFLGGHSAGTGFAARYASTDFNLSGSGPADPGYAKLRGLVLLEGGGGSTAGTALTEDTLDRIEAKFDGGLFGAVRDNLPRCVDGDTACTIGNEATDCAAFSNTKCTLPTTAFSTSSLLNPRIFAAVEPAAIQGITDPDSGQIILQVDQGSAGNDAITKVPDLTPLSILPQSTVMGGIGSFLDDDGLVASLASFVATSLGAPGATVGGLLTWQDVTEGPMPPSVIPNNGPIPTTLPATRWGQEKEVTRFDRMLTTFYAGGSNFADWYYPSAGPSTTSVQGLCSGLSGTCLVGNVGASCSGANQSAANAACSQSVNLDSTALSVGRDRPDIENLTQAANIDIPVIGFGGSNGGATVPAAFIGFANSIGICTAPSCDGSTPRVVDASNPNPAFPTYGDVSGGFETYISEGFAHVDVLTAEDDSNNNVLKPLSDFIARNLQ